MNQAQSLQSFNRLIRISGELTNTDNVMNNTFWIGVQPALTREMLEFAATKIESYLGVNF
jgi:CDP-6-deoxy-D-xylo-4-hexulose-3-dehydrase